MKNNLRVLRAMKDISQEQLATELGVTRVTINAVENNKYNPSLELAFKMALFFEKPIEEIFTYKNE
ncbi:MAG: helix-turn-helix transcriptional regulator [Promethearchaeota archaeon]